MNTADAVAALPSGAVARRMGLDDLRTVLDWAAAEGWNPGFDDAEPFLAADPDGFFLAEIDGRPAAAISVVNHSDAFAFLGLYICRPAHRGTGLGFALWRHAMDHAGTRTVGLDGVPDQQPNYRKSGFVLTGQTRRFEGRPEARGDPAIRPARAGEVAALTAMEAAANGYAKPGFCAAWFRETPTRRTLVLDDGGEIHGFATWRRCRRDVKVGPLVARGDAAAIRLLHHVAAEVAPAALVIDVPDHCEGLTRHCASLGMTVSFGTARMYRGIAPTAGPGCHTIATLELG